MVAEETPLRLAELGIPVIETRGEAGATVVLDDELIAQLWGNLDPNFMTALQAQQSLDLAFDDANYADLSSEMMQLTGLDDSIVLEDGRAYEGFEFQ